MRYFFTYGTAKSFDFCGGWSEVYADNYEMAVKIFELYHPPIKHGIINCADIYSEQNFAKTKMWVDGNCGAKCQEIITCNNNIIDHAGDFKYQVNIFENDKCISTGILKNNLRVLINVQNELCKLNPNSKIEILLYK